MARFKSVFHRRSSAFRAGALVDALEPRQLLTELITNGNFARNAAGWTVAGDFEADARFSTAHTGPGYAYLSSYDGSTSTSNSLSGTLKQSISIAPDASSASLTFYQRITTTETGSTAHDTLAVRIRSSTGATLATLTTLSNLNASSSYSSVGPFDLSSYAGQTIAISFEASTNSTLGTVFRIDDVSVTSNLAGGAVDANVPAPTPIGPGIPTTTGVPTVDSPVPMFRWNATSSASTYSVLIERNAGRGSYTKFADSNDTLGTQFTGTSYSSPTPLDANTYRWTVFAYDGTGAVTAASVPLYFTVVPSGYTRAVGVDISDYQTVTSWSTIKTNGTSGTTSDDTSFVYVKATEGATFNASKYTSLTNGAAGVGIPAGAYHFARPGSNSALTEATHFYNIIKTHLTGGTLRPMLDFEDPNSSSTSMGKTALSQWANDFCEDFIALSGGIVPIIYTYVSYATSYLDTSVLRYPLWQAQYPSNSPSYPIPVSSGAPSSTSPWPTGGWSIWQYTSVRPVAGFTGSVDADVSNSSIDSFYDAFKIPSTTKGSISGTLFTDDNSNGLQDSGEDGVGNRAVYIDANNNGILDPSEISIETGRGGTYTFPNLLTGTYVVRQVVPTDYIGTSPVALTTTLAAGAAVVDQDFGSRPLDVVPPTVLIARYDYDRSPATITLVFSEDVGDTLSATDAVLTPTAGGEAVPLTLTYSAETFTATFTPTSPLADGDYVFQLPAGQFADAVGNANDAYEYDFFQLAGDINRDRTVGFDDLLVIAQHYGTTTGATFADGDLTSDGAVGFDDLLLLAQNYSHALLTVAPQAKAAQVASPRKGDRVSDSILR